MAQPLLPDLLIEGYRGLRRLELKKLGNVNLLVGENGVGKTSVLEAVRLYSSHAAFPVLGDLLQNRDEIVDPYSPAHLSALFTGRPLRFHSDHSSALIPKINVGTVDSPLSFVIRWSTRTVESDGAIRYVFPDQNNFLDPIERFTTICVEQRGTRLRFAPLHRGPAPYSAEYVDLPGMSQNPSHFYIPAHGLDGLSVASQWDKIVLTRAEDEVNDELNRLSSQIQRVSVIQGIDGNRRVMAKVSAFERPVPLHSLGEGIHRFLGITLALVNARDGFLLIDEFENGLHYKTQEALWKFVIRAARKLNVQVFATTHSRDCIDAFGRAAEEDQDSFGVLTKLERIGEDVVAKQLYEDDIVIASQNLVEIR